MQVQVDYVDGRDEEAVAKALPGAKLFYMESPTSWVMEAHDVGALATIAKQHGVLSIIDNSWASPIFQRPLSLGVDLVVHSASKYLGGHSDVVAGVVTGSKELINAIRAETYPYLGGKLSPFDAWLLVRGMRTLPTRMKAHEASALEIAKRLQALDVVETVCHPALANRLPAGLKGTSGLFSVIFREGVNIREFCNHLDLFKLGVSWGGHESLIVPGEVVLQQKAQPNSAHTFGIDPRSVRLHVGLEGTEALWRDIEGALTASTE
jgi:cystathionine beta-lyase/cystathionine gamma-synthase